MERIENLNELEIGDWIKVYQTNGERYPFKIGEITNKWKQKDKPNFELKIFRTNLPPTTEKMIYKFFKDNKNFNNYLSKRNTINYKERVFRLNKKEKDVLLKELILEEL